MKKENRKHLYFAIGWFLFFVLWTALLCFWDVRAVGAQGTEVGFSSVNQWFHSMTGVHWFWYNLTDWLGLVPIGVAFGFSLLGAWQWLRRKQLRKVDRNLFVLGGFYLVVMAVYLFFENVVVNYRPILIQGYLEASYPSSTTMLVLCVIPTAILQLKERIRNSILQKGGSLILIFFLIGMVLGRVVSGVHWLTDIVGGILISLSLIRWYRWGVSLVS